MSLVDWRSSRPERSRTRVEYDVDGGYRGSIGRAEDGRAVGVRPWLHAAHLMNRVRWTAACTPASRVMACRDAHSASAPSPSVVLLWILSRSAPRRCIFSAVLRLIIGCCAVFVQLLFSAF
ncbi:hypothetical protein BV25DRAFT_159627 [Artomyces pyxidatus]|uniref:Uncharacterized protein n=1 Tax=Artomyces pyxidatus TaxID=48021 RepID=A0ACB8TAS6_9AGAM|nr:hypothetical protein BV25DRAFT_159627 [Artomyces pyxidatus]